MTSSVHQTTTAHSHACIHDMKEFEHRKSAKHTNPIVYHKLTLDFTLKRGKTAQHHCINMKHSPLLQFIDVFMECAFMYYSDSKPFIHNNINSATSRAYKRIHTHTLVFILDDQVGSRTHTLHSVRQKMRQCEQAYIKERQNNYAAAMLISFII